MTLKLFDNLDSIKKNHIEKISLFLKSLSSEKKYFLLDIDDILKAEFIIVDILDNEITGITGIRKKFMIPIYFIIVKKKYQSKKIGKLLLNENFRILSSKHHFVMSTVDENNSKMMKWSLRLNHKLIGMIGNRVYFYHFFDNFGKISFYFFKFLFVLFYPIFHFRKY